MTCPTPCDDDCTADCHEGHQVFWKREHCPTSHGCPCGNKGACASILCAPRVTC